MKYISTFILGFISSLAVVLVTYLWKTPILLCEISEHNPAVYFRVKNFGFSNADWMEHQLLLSSEVNLPPKVNKKYWINNKNINSFLKYEKDKNQFKIIFSDIGFFNKFETNEELELELKPKNSNTYVKVMATDLEAFKAQKAYIFKVENIKVFESLFKWSIFVLIVITIFATPYIFLGYALIKNKITIKFNK